MLIWGNWDDLAWPRIGRLSRGVACVYVCMYVCMYVTVCSCVMPGGIHAGGMARLCCEGVESMYVYSSAGSTSSSCLQHDLERVDKQPRTVPRSLLAGHHRVFRVTHKHMAE